MLRSETEIIERIREIEGERIGDLIPSFPLLNKEYKAFCEIRKEIRIDELKWMLMEEK